MKFEIEYIEQLADLVSKSGLTELILEDGEQAILLKKEKEIVTTQTVSYAPQAPAVAAPAAKAEEAKPAAPAGKPVLSPMVGTFSSAPSPGAKPFAQVGDSVTVGQTVCIIEAMKLMNEIESEASGKVIQILVEDGQPVEYGQVLMYVD